MNLWKEFNKVGMGFIMALGAFKWFEILGLPYWLCFAAGGFGAYAGIVIYHQAYFKEPEKPFELEVPKNQWGR